MTRTEHDGSIAVLMDGFDGRPLNAPNDVVVKSDAINIVDKLLNDLGPRYRNRPGGYTRVLKRTERRLGDAAPTAFLELLSASEGSAASPAAPATPTVVD